MSLAIFRKFASIVTGLGEAEVNDPQSAHGLQLATEIVGTRQVRMIYAPFDHINATARRYRGHDSRALTGRQRAARRENGIDARPSSR